MRIYLGETELPVMPETFRMQYQTGREGGYISGLGEVSLYQPPKLKRISFSGMFPKERERFVTSQKFLSPKAYAQALEGLLKSKTAFRLVVTQNALPLSMTAVVSAFSFAERAGEEGTLYYDLALLEYRSFGPKPLSVSAGTGAAGTGSSPASSAPLGGESGGIRYTVRTGDTLWAIAKRFLGNGSLYTVIAACNGIKNPNLIYTGQVLRIPQGV